jgi:ceramide glucosyltransferase
MQILQFVEILAALALFAVLAIKCLMVASALWPRAAISRTEAFPPVSVIVPIAATEQTGESEHRSIFSQSYPPFEVILAGPESAAMAAARRVSEDFPQVATSVVVPTIKIGGNPKIENLVAAAAAAKHDLIVIKDAKSMLIGGQLAELVSHLRPGTGLVSAVPVGMNPVTFGGDLECAILNARYAPMLFAASKLFRLNFGLGALMLLRRGDLDRIGGFQVLANTIGEDKALSNIMARQGLRSVVADEVVRQSVDSRSLREVWDRHRRWAIARRQEATIAFLTEPLFGALFACLAAALAAPLIGADRWMLVFAVAAFWFLTDIIVVYAKGWGASWRFPFACVFREGFILAAWICALLMRNIRWGGNTVRLTR